MFGINDNNQSNKMTDQPADVPMPDPINQSTPPASIPQPEPASSTSAPTLPEQPSVDAPMPPTATPAEAPSANNDLLMGLKQQALQDLQPLVNHLDQTPEEKFKTTMMLIQSTDNSSLIKQAYEAANQIQDEKKKAQALLDVVNEINYFSHNSKNGNNTENNNPQTI
jgi:hypothetical protein